MTGKAARDRLLEEQQQAKNKYQAEQSKKGSVVNKRSKDRTGTSKKQVQHMQSFKSGAAPIRDEETKEESGSNVEALGTKGSSNNMNQFVSEKDSSNQLNRRMSDKVSSAISGSIR